MSQVGEFDEREERPAFVRFERRAVEDKKASLEAGRSVSKDVDFALVTAPYSKDIHEVKVKTWFENKEREVKVGRTPKPWLDHWKKSYAAFQEGHEAPLNGTPIRDWSAISPAQIKNLIAINILTIEDLAAVNDQGLARIGMGGVELKRKAQNWLDTAENLGGVTLKVTQLETDLSRALRTIEDLTEKNTELMRRLEAVSQPIAVQPTGISASDILDEAPVLEVIKTPAERYTEKFGKAPHHLMKDETILKKLEE